MTARPDDDCRLCWATGEVLDQRETRITGWPVYGRCSCVKNVPQLTRVIGIAERQRILEAQRQIRAANEARRNEALERFNKVGP